MLKQATMGVSFALLAATGCTSQPAASSTASATAVAPSRPDRFQAIPFVTGLVPAITPRGLSGERRVNVVVHMSAEPVAAVQARSGRRLTEAEHQAAEDVVRAQHAAVEPELRARGGKVLARFHDALNGLKIQIDRSQVSAVAALPGVTKVTPVGMFRRENAVSVPFLGTPAVWAGASGFRGEGVKVAVIDTGIDYTHANFGGPGTPAAFDAAFAASTLPADPALFGPDAPKVKGGTDLVGNDYDPDDSLPPDAPQNVPQPDPNPLDCNGANVGHGSHVSGTAAGFGVTAAGATFTGPYDTTTPSLEFTIGPGVAPKADLYAVRVFGCAGATNVVTEAIDWAVHNGMDVINMSLGSPFGTADAASALASENAVKAGIIVVASAGNEGPSPYITGSPASGNGVISVAATDSTATFPAANVALSPSGQTIVAQNSNEQPLPAGALSIVVLRNANNTISLGCSEAEYVDAVIGGKLVVTLRGTCARVDRAKFGFRHGAAAVAMINNGAGYPPFEGDILDGGTLVAIPFLGVQGRPSTDRDALAASASATLTPTTLANPGFRAIVGFSSAGPRFGDSVLKPNVTAPGVSIKSTLVGSGNQGQVLSGTSMASPHVAGVAALVRQAHPTWTTAAQRAAIVQTADPGGLVRASPRTAGTGLVQPVGATRTQAVVLQQNEAAQSVSFGFAELGRDFQGSQELTVRNNGSSPIAFNVAATPASGAPHTATVSRSTLQVPAGGSAGVQVGLAVPAATVGDATHFREVSGLVTFTPATPTANGGVTLTVPYYLVPRALSDVRAEARNFGPRRTTSSVTLRNQNGVIAGNGDFYAWGLESPPQGLAFFDPRAVGVQAFPDVAESQLVFAINLHTRFSNAAAGEFDVLIDSDGDGVADFDVVGVDLGAITAGDFNGILASFTFDLRTAPATIVDAFLADAPTDGSTVLLPFLASEVGLSPENPRFTYAATVFNLLDDTSADVPGTASFNAFAPAISTGQFVSVAPGARATVPISIDPAEWALTPALGLMVVTEDNAAGRAEAALLPAGGAPSDRSDLARR